ncbi:hypothetical protein PGTUg99_024271 [Puccinia graminis f. sp. tritici]|uniref:Secreted protein n=1 Tax=Puccinia graminis f. sp. tritici TaxID=56615 RepID=A0A5B0S3E4_PUCGR|nr:hypothetical protein PGTUg99_024271 [Puccinia graminis f. sp. tritici]
MKRHQLTILFLSFSSLIYEQRAIQLVGAGVLHSLYPAMGHQVSFIREENVKAENQKEIANCCHSHPQTMQRNGIDMGDGGTSNSKVRYLGILK